jgi:hypothetical protein
MRTRAGTRAGDAVTRRRALVTFTLASALVAGAWATSGCAGGKGSWNPDDTRKATQITQAAKSLLELCSDDDGGTCRPSHVRALGTVIECKSASMLYAHREGIPEDAGGGCAR